MKKIKLGLVGCGFLGGIIVDAWKNGLLPEFEFCGCINRSPEAAAALAAKASCQAFSSIDELLAQKPDYVIEAASPAVIAEIAEKVLLHGSNLIVLSIGAFADANLLERVKSTARTMIRKKVGICQKITSLMNC